MEVKMEETYHKNEEERKQMEEAKWRRKKANGGREDSGFVPDY